MASVSLYRLDANPPWWFVAVQNKSTNDKALARFNSEILKHLCRRIKGFEGSAVAGIDLINIANECIRVCRRGMMPSAVMERAEGLASYYFKIGDTVEEWQQGS